MIFHDQLQRKVELKAFPTRIISLVPSQTELLFSLGLEQEIIGITKFCIHPEHWFRTKTRVGGTKNLQMEKIRQMAPDLIIANKEENTRDQIEELAKEFPVWISDVNSLSDAYEMITLIGRMVNKAQQAKSMVEQIMQKFTALNFSTRHKACYLIWKEPFMTIGSDTFINSMLTAAGFENVYSDHSRYPETDMDNIRASGCEVLMLSSEPYPFSKKDADEIQRLLPSVRVVLVDGEMFSWYGSRLLRSVDYFSGLHEQLKNSINTHAGSGSALKKETFFPHQ